MLDTVLKELFKNTGKAVLLIFVLMATPMGMMILHTHFTKSDEVLCLEKIKAFVIKQDEYEKKLDTYEQGKLELEGKLSELAEQDKMTRKQLEFCTQHCSRKIGNELK